MNKKMIFSLTMGIINSLIIIGLIVFLTLPKKTNNTASDIFYKNLNSIVEIKAVKEDYAESYGTGVIYNKEGYIITNCHIISYKELGETMLFDTFEVRFPSKEEYQKASFIKMDEKLDLAILKIDEIAIYNPISFSNINYTYGDTVYAMGNTSNYGIGISQGIISVPEVNIIYEDNERLVIQANIDISSGNSGGALLDINGCLIGITTFRTKDQLGNVNYGFAYSIPLKHIKKFISEG